MLAASPFLGILVSDLDDPPASLMAAGQLRLFGETGNPNCLRARPNAECARYSEERAGRGGDSHDAIEARDGCRYRSDAAQSFSRRFLQPAFARVR